MCGRTALFTPQEALETYFDATVVADGGYTPRYNITPGESLAVITNETPDEIERYHWGLIPPWAEDPSEGLSNARAETADQKRSFRDAWASRPCLVLSSGFYEWQTHSERQNQPYRIYRDGAPAFAMAGLWETWTGGDEESSCVTILTTEANDLMQPIHHRMPVVLSHAAEETWLSAGPAERATLCQPSPTADLEAEEISTRVNNPANDDPSVIEPLAHEQSGLDEFGSTPGES